MPCQQPKTGSELGSSNRDAAIESVFALTDQVEFLSQTYKAYEAVERLTTGEKYGSAENLPLTRDDLGALFLVLNRSMRADLEKANVLVKSCLTLTGRL